MGDDGDYDEGSEGDLYDDTRAPPDEAHDVASDDHVRRDVSGLIQLTLDSGLPLRSDWPRKAVRPLWRCMLLLQM